MSCDTIRKQLSLVLYGELSFDEEESVHQHLETCPACQAEYHKVQSLHRCLDSSEAPFPPELLVNCRRNLRVTVAALQESGLVHRENPLAAVRRWFAAGSWAWKPAAGVALVALGFFGGQFSSRNTTLLGGLGEPSISRVRYVQPDDSGNVRLVVEDVRQREISGGLDDSRIRGLLVSAARESADPGVRVETMSLLKAHTESAEVKRALLSALQTDTNPGVRLKALEALRPTAGQDPDTRRVLAQVLLTDDNPGVRTQAIDLLTQRRERALVGVLQELMARESNNYVRLKCQKALADMNASVETF